MKSLLTFYFVLYFSFSFASETVVNAFVLSDETNISSFVPKSKISVLSDRENSYKISEIKTYEGLFEPLTNYKYDPYNYYIQKFQIKNNSSIEQTFSVTSPRVIR